MFSLLAIAPEPLHKKPGRNVPMNMTDAPSCRSVHRTSAESWTLGYEVKSWKNKIKNKFLDGMATAPDRFIDVHQKFSLSNKR